MSIKRIVRKHRASRGQSLVELALITPLMLLLLLAAIDLGRLFYAQITIANSAREGAMVAAAESDVLLERRGLQREHERSHLRGHA